MNGLNERQIKVLEESEEWHWRAMLVGWRFALVPCLYAWRAAMLLLVGFLALPAAILIGIVCMICCFIDESRDAFFSLINSRWLRMKSLHRVAGKILNGQGEKK